MARLYAAPTSTSARTMAHMCTHEGIHFSVRSSVSPRWASPRTMKRTDVRWYAALVQTRPTRSAVKGVGGVWAMAYTRGAHLQRTRGADAGVRREWPSSHGTVPRAPRSAAAARRTGVSSHGDADATGGDGMFVSSDTNGTPAPQRSVRRDAGLVGSGHLDSRPRPRPATGTDHGSRRGALVPCLISASGDRGPRSSSSEDRGAQACGHDSGDSGSATAFQRPLGSVPAAIALDWQPASVEACCNG